MPKHVFFDLDNTLTLSRRPMKPEHAPIFDELCRARDVIVVTGGTQVHIEEQVGLANGRYFMLAQSGNHAIDKAGAELWREELTAEQVNASLAVIAKMRALFNEPVKDENDLIDNRGAQIGFSVIGYHEDPTRKDKFDPDFSRRKRVLSDLTEDVHALRATGIEVFPAGSSGYNFTIIGKDKGVNVARLIEREGWQRQDAVYVGDALGPGENDHSVVGVITTHAVSGPDDTFTFIKEVLS